jgi:hypothetical protein
MMAAWNAPPAGWQEAFWIHLERTGGQIVISAELAGTTNRTVENYRNSCPEFRERWRQVWQRITADRRDRAKRDRDHHRYRQSVRRLDL